ncbi:uncharacterized protein Z519_09119 [Cladophialophora bantiana CBS 173.52]|uniref:Uncharacterized protein n=1 Tax=Cladophialophora bantiana (strain ATCC 10958 / CBS 173.52 / CDC B-1940 / NIH 8579) TaxID=1442370 RepID=A0A0D2HB66_CLAB1|nr:uncharacterized protein Z519_09119 [Cladophialophora bantiana CBS 173.52]KIW90473.1 hypothetical protein Z519_09119 [Cladophialophora bantiana CBS 173.52]
MIKAVWQTFPVHTGVANYLLRKYAVEDTTAHDRIHNAEADLPYVGLTVWAFTGISATFSNWTRSFLGISLARIFFPDSTTLTCIIFLGQDQLDLVTGTRLLLLLFQAVEIACFAAAFLWLAFLAHDLKQAEMASIGRLKAIMFAIAGTYLLGSGAVVALTWWWRENNLATKTKGSVIGRIGTNPEYCILGDETETTMNTWCLAPCPRHALSGGPSSSDLKDNYHSGGCFLDMAIETCGRQAIRSLPIEPYPGLDHLIGGFSPLELVCFKECAHLG